MPDVRTRLLAAVKNGDDVVTFGKMIDKSHMQGRMVTVSFGRQFCAR